MNPTTLQVHAEEIFREALRAVDARAATRRADNSEGLPY